MFNFAEKGITLFNFHKFICRNRMSADTDRSFLSAISDTPRAAVLKRSVFFKNLTKFTGKHLLQAATLLKSDFSYEF